MAANDLTTLDQAKAWLGITNSNSDAVLTRLVSAASSAVQARIGYQLLTQAYTEQLDGNGKSVLAFGNPRVTAVSAVSIDGATVAARSSVTGAGYTFDADFLFLIGRCFTRGRQNVAVTYTAGYAAAPLDLEQAVLEVIALKFKERDHTGISSKTLAGEVISFFRNVSTDTTAVIDNYRRVVAP